MTTQEVEDWMETKIEGWNYTFTDQDWIKNKFEEEASKNNRTQQWNGFVNGSKYSNTQIRKKWGPKRSQQHSGWSGYYNSPQSNLSKWVNNSIEKNESYKSEQIKIIKKSKDVSKIDNLSFNKNKYTTSTIGELEEEKFIRVQTILRKRADLENRINAATSKEEMLDISFRDYEDVIDLKVYRNWTKEKDIQFGLR